MLNKVHIILICHFGVVVFSRARYWFEPGKIYADQLINAKFDFNSKKASLVTSFFIIWKIHAKIKVRFSATKKFSLFIDLFIDMLLSEKNYWKLKKILRFKMLIENKSRKLF